MNENHRRLCPSDEWRAYLHDEVLPSVTALVELGGALVEIGPGPGASTEWLRRRVARLVAVELDPEAALALEARFEGTNVEVVLGDATCLDLPDGAFDAVATFTMLHHVPTLAAQRAIVAEAFRVLRPGGSLFGSDSLASTGLHEFHAGDAYNPIDPAVLLVLLRALGFEELTIRVSDVLTFAARKPSPPEEQEEGER